MTSQGGINPRQMAIGSGREAGMVVRALSTRSRACESTKRGQLNGSRTLRWQSRTTHARVRARGQGTYRREVVAVQMHVAQVPE